MRTHLGCIVAIALTPTLAVANEAEVALPCRPTIACTAEIVSPGKVELELGYAGRDAGAVFQHSTPALLKLTVSERLQLQIGSNGWVTDRSHGYLDDTLASAKLVVVKQAETVPAVAVSGGVGIPMVSSLRTHGTTLAGQGIAYVTKDLLSLHADLNLGANVLAADGAQHVQPFAALAVSRDVGYGLAAMAEGYLFTAAGPLAASDHGLLLAVGWSLAPDVVLDVGTDWGMGGQERRFTVFAGVTLLSPKLWGR